VSDLTLRERLAQLIAFWRDHNAGEIPIGEVEKLLASVPSVSPHSSICSWHIRHIDDDCDCKAVPSVSPQENLCDASTQTVQKDTASGTNGPSGNFVLTGKLNAPTAASTPSGLEKGRSVPSVSPEPPACVFGEVRSLCPICFVALDSCQHGAATVSPEPPQSALRVIFDLAQECLDITVCDQIAKVARAALAATVSQPGTLRADFDKLREIVTPEMKERINEYRESLEGEPAAPSPAHKVTCSWHMNDPCDCGLVPPVQTECPDCHSIVRSKRGILRFSEGHGKERRCTHMWHDYIPAQTETEPTQAEIDSLIRLPEHGQE
jgi:hypothetical protein